MRAAPKASEPTRCSFDPRNAVPTIGGRREVPRAARRERAEGDRARAERLQIDDDCGPGSSEGREIQFLAPEKAGKRVRDLRIEFPAGAFLDDVLGLERRHGLPGRPVADKCVVAVCDRDDARADRDAAVDQVLALPEPVEEIVAREDHRENAPQRHDRRDANAVGLACLRPDT